MSSLSKDARLAGALYILGSIFGVVRLMYIPSKLIVSRNAAATASNIAAHQSLFRFGILTDLVGSVVWIFVTLALYRLLRRVDQELAALMVILGSLMVVPLFFMNTVNDAGALLFARAAQTSCSFSTSRSAKPSLCCSSACITRVRWPMRSFGGYGCCLSESWCTSHNSCPAFSDSG